VLTCGAGFVPSSLDPPRLRASRVPFRVRCNLRFGRLALFFLFWREGRRKRQSILNNKKKTDRSTDGKHRENNEMNERPRRVVNNPEKWLGIVIHMSCWRSIERENSYFSLHSRDRRRRRGRRPAHMAIRQLLPRYVYTKLTAFGAHLDSTLQWKLIGDVLERAFLVLSYFSSKTCYSLQPFTMDDGTLYIKYQWCALGV
jgi:hypothetical protein